MNAVPILNAITVLSTLAAVGICAFAFWRFPGGGRDRLKELCSNPEVPK